jgi:MYXO-CTERM domain-containing protein
LLRTVKTIGALALLLGGSAVASSASAHESPHGTQLVFPSTAADAAPIVVTNRGMLFPKTASVGTAYSLRCNEAYGVTTSNVPRAVLDDKGSLLIASSVGVRTSSDKGCSWKLNEKLPDVSLGGFTQNASMPAELLVSTFTYMMTSQVFGSTDYGNTWTPKFSNAPLSVYETMLSSPDGKRVLASGHRFEQSTRKLLALWALSNDGGATWTETELTDDRFPLGFHPTDPNIVFAREPIPNLTIDPRDRLMRSSDGGKTFELVKEVSFLDTFAATPDGSTLWLGSQVEGLQVSKDGGKTFNRVLEEMIVSIYCLAYRQGRLWACTRVSPNTGGIHYSDDLGATFTKLLQFEDVTTEAVCANDTEMKCTKPWADWTYELLTNFDDAGVPADAGGAAIAKDGGTTSGEGDAGVVHTDAGHTTALDGGGEKAGKKSDGGCSAFAGGDGSSAALTPMFVLGALALVTRRRRRDR